MRAIGTPWGMAQSEETIGDGIVVYTTASHGGYRLSDERQAEVEARIPEFEPWAGTGWYEEDCDWAVVALMFPAAFPEDAQQVARRTVSMLRSNSAAWDAVGRAFGVPWGKARTT